MAGTGDHDDPHRALSARVHGRVQGVGFRYASQECALRLGLVGRVANAWDGTVEVVAEGSEEALLRFIAWLHSGPPLARVERVDVRWQTPSGGYDRFEVS
jgi:acylphosphatase